MAGIAVLGIVAMKVLRTPLLLAALILSACFGLAAPPPAAPIITGYLFPRGAALVPGKLALKNLDRINYAFARTGKGRIETDSDADARNFALLNDLKRENPSLTILISVGGWSGSRGFSDIALTTASRRRFIESVIEFLRLYRLDGLDVDWEYPASTGAGNRYRPADKHNFTLLVKELREQFSLEEKKTHNKLYLTIAAGASDEYLSNTEMAEVAKYVDTVNLMTYDYSEPGVDPLTGHNAPLYANPADARRVSSDQTVEAFEKAGVPPEKILLGVPFYGRIWSGVDATNHGLFQPGKVAPQQYAPYRIISGMLKEGFVRYWDAASQVPYLYNPAKRIFVSYDDPASMAAKARYARSRHLGGIMFWESTDDPEGTLLGALRAGLNADNFR